ncbi:tRNA lysidine(34) synthetase TilS [Arenibaculum sp.]|uniref:tRNA lysidine(34) synthetase TilS n=1 Tax=Arenibaculum sp. TaxID=2865862 RepID=UPI002E12B382|nr:tRNA lysidine(34) synthetase TilS [Arenibaculum sp.]
MTAASPDPDPPGHPPIGEGEFARLLARLGPFEPRPRLAVAVSGGADSMALCLLARDWARARGGDVLALTVDHGLRPDSAAEARAVGAGLAALGVAHAVLEWSGPKPGTGIQEAAREARYRLIEARCRAEGILHVLLGHHLDDQAETVLLRLARGSGVDGLAGIAPVRELGACRLLRPLLGVPGARLRATLEARGLPWIEDPSNGSARFARARLRAAAGLLRREGLGPEALSATARRCARARSALERAAAGLLAEAAVLRPEGWALLERDSLGRAAEEVALRALAGVLGAVGGSGRPIRLDRLERLRAALLDGPAKARTAAGCLVRDWRGRVLVCREPEAVSQRLTPMPGETALWDGRFSVTVPAGGCEGLVLARLGDAGWRALPARRRDLVKERMPHAVALGTPAIWRGDELVSAPILGCGPLPPGDPAGDRAGDTGIAIAFAPPRSIGGASFPVV